MHEEKNCLLFKIYFTKCEESIVEQKNCQLLTCPFPRHVHKNIPISCLHIILIFFFHYAYHRLWHGSMSLEVFMILFDVSFLSDVELTSILSYSMHIVTQSRCSLLFVSAADGDLCQTKRPRLLRMAQ